MGSQPARRRGGDGGGAIPAGLRQAPPELRTRKNGREGRPQGVGIVVSSPCASSLLYIGVLEGWGHSPSPSSKEGRRPKGEECPPSQVEGPPP